MLFNTIDFVIFFITVISLFVMIKNRRFQHVFLIAASYFFFYYSSNYLITLLIYTTIWDFYFGKIIWRETNIRKKKILLICSLAGNLGLLGFFKYADFAIVQFNLLGNYFDLKNNIPLLNLVLPIGISFYTFHSITYIVSIYRGEIQPAKSFTDYAIFVAFFPQLIAGPILRAKDFLPQLREKIENFQSTKLRQIIITKSNLKLGITLMAFGFVKKMFFADNIARVVNQVFFHPVGDESFLIILGTIAFGIQIYCDFSGYSDIAIGASTVMGFKIPINFNKPYFATSPSDFWRRWHISLSSWLRDYLYIPLGGNRKSKTRTYLNLFVVMFLGGLWHGASWNFVIWGVLHGLYLAIHKIITNRFPRIANKPFFRTKFGIILSILVTQYFVFLAWIPFRIKDVNDMLYCIQKYVIWDFSSSQTVGVLLANISSIGLIPLFVLLHFITHKKPDLVEKIANLKIHNWSFFLIGVAFLIFLFYNGKPENFIYFKF